MLPNTTYNNVPLDLASRKSPIASAGHFARGRMTAPFRLQNVKKYSFCSFGSKDADGVNQSPWFQQRTISGVEEREGARVGAQSS